MGSAQIRSFVKWPGGKANLLRRIVTKKRGFDVLVDPFFGGGSSLFFFFPNKKALLSDLSQDLVSFYKLLFWGSNKEKYLLLDYVLFWDNLSEYIFLEKIDKTISRKPPEFLEKNWGRLISEVEKSVRKKREYLEGPLSLKYKSKGRNLGKEEIRKHLQTAIRSGVYNFFRSGINGEVSLNETERTIFFFLVRELCLGSMFRFSKRGKFNIPYGGISYNKKKLAPKAGKLLDLSSKIISKIEVYIERLDFREALRGFIDKLYEEDHLLFLDPPYLTEFSHYDQNHFTERDHKELAELLLDTKYKFFLIVAGETLKIYEELPFRKLIFRDKFSFSIKGRNKKETDYLVVTNHEDFDVLLGKGG